MILHRTATLSSPGGWTPPNHRRRRLFLDRVQGTVRLDCSGLEYISSAGLGVLLKTHKRLSGSSGALRLAGVHGHLQDIFLYSGFDRLLTIEPAP